MNKKWFLSIVFSFILAPLFCAYNTFGIPDSSEIRKHLYENWFEASLEQVRMNLPEIYSNDAGEKFQVRLEETESEFNIFVAACSVINVNVYTKEGVTKQQQEVYPGDVAGSWVLVRDKKTGNPIRVRYYFASNSDVYIQFSPYGKTALADMVIFGNYCAKGVATGVPFKSFYKTSFQDILDMTEKSLPWEYVIVDNSLYNSVLQMAGVIQKNLPRILFVNNAMYNETNELVQITNGKPFDSEEDSSNNRLYLSSAGFIKWIADGLVEPIAGSQLKREPLLNETVEVNPTGLQGVMSQKFGLNFSLDWIRNISAAVISVYTGRTYKYENSGVDVTINPFAASISSDGTKNVITFIEDSGYNIEVLKSLLYVLAATDPGTIYFGAIRETDQTVSPEVKYFSENVVFLPYFASNNSFGCFVFMNGRAISLEDFCDNYKDTFVYLTKCRSSENFYPN